MIWFIAFLVLLVIGCYCTYRSAEVHELHRMRAAFENKKHEIERLVREYENEKDFNKIFYEGEISELEELKKDIDKRIDELKAFDLD